MKKVIFLVIFIIFSFINIALAYSQEPKGDIYYSKKMYGNAIKFYEKSLKKDKTNAELVYKLAASYYHIANYDKAFQYFETAYNLNKQPTNSEFLLYYANVLKIKEKYLSPPILLIHLMRRTIFHLFEHRETFLFHLY